MVYKPLNAGLPNKKETSISKRIREQRLANNDRYEYQKSMYGNVHTIIDHRNKYYYRQDQEIIEQLNLLDEYLPRYCDYCKSDCDEITLVDYELSYEMVVRPKTNPELKRDTQIIKYASCDECLETISVFVPPELKSGYVIEIRQGNQSIWKSGLLYYDNKLRKPYGSI